MVFTAASIRKCYFEINNTVDLSLTPSASARNVKIFLGIFPETQLR